MLAVVLGLMHLCRSVGQCHTQSAIADGITPVQQYVRFHYVPMTGNGSHQWQLKQAETRKTLQFVRNLLIAFVATDNLHSLFPAEV